MHFTIQLGAKENRLLYRGLRYIEVRFIEVSLYVTSVEYKSTMQSFWQGGGGGSTKFYAGSLHPEVQPLILFIYHQDTIFDNFNHFSIPLYHNFHWQMVPLSHT